VQQRIAYEKIAGGAFGVDCGAVFRIAIGGVLVVRRLVVVEIRGRSPLLWAVVGGSVLQFSRILGPVLGLLDRDRVTAAAKVTCMGDMPKQSVWDDSLGGHHDLDAVWQPLLHAIGRRKCRFVGVDTDARLSWGVGLCWGVLLAHPCCRVLRASSAMRKEQFTAATRNLSC